MLPALQAAAGRVVDAGRHDRRWIMVEAANYAARHHPR